MQVTPNVDPSRFRDYDETRKKDEKEKAADKSAEPTQKSSSAPDAVKSTGNKKDEPPKRQSDKPAAQAKPVKSPADNVSTAKKLSNQSSSSEKQVPANPASSPNAVKSTSNKKDEPPKPPSDKPAAELKPAAAGNVSTSQKPPSQPGNGKAPVSARHVSTPSSQTNEVSSATSSAHRIKRDTPQHSGEPATPPLRSGASSPAFAVVDINPALITPNVIEQFQSFNSQAKSLKENSPADVRTQVSNYIRDTLTNSTGQDVDPDKTQAVRFSGAEAQQDGNDGVTGWQHKAGEVKQSSTLTDLVMQGMDDQWKNSNSSTLNAYHGFYKSDENTKTYDASNEVKLLPSDFRNLFDNDKLEKYLGDKQDSFWQSQKNTWRTMAKTEFSSTAKKASLDGALTKNGYELAMKGAASNVPLDGPAKMSDMAAEATPDPSVTVRRFDIDGYNATDVLRFTGQDGRNVLYIPGSSQGFYEFQNEDKMKNWVIDQSRDPVARQELASHFSVYDRSTGKWGAFSRSGVNEGLGDLASGKWDAGSIDTGGETVHGDAFTDMAERTRQRSKEDLAQIAGNSGKRQIWLDDINHSNADPLTRPIARALSATSFAGLVGAEGGEVFVRDTEHGRRAIDEASGMNVGLTSLLVPQQLSAESADASYRFPTLEGDSATASPKQTEFSTTTFPPGNTAQAINEIHDKIRKITGEANPSMFNSLSEVEQRSAVAKNKTSFSRVKNSLDEVYRRLDDANRILHDPTEKTNVLASLGKSLDTTNESALNQAYERLAHLASDTVTRFKSFKDSGYNRVVFFERSDRSKPFPDAERNNPTSAFANLNNRNKLAINLEAPDGGRNKVSDSEAAQRYNVELVDSITKQLTRLSNNTQNFMNVMKEETKDGFALTSAQTALEQFKLARPNDVACRQVLGRDPTHVDASSASTQPTYSDDERLAVLNKVWNDDVTRADLLTSNTDTAALYLRDIGGRRGHDTSPTYDYFLEQAKKNAPPTMGPDAIKRRADSEYLMSMAHGLRDLSHYNGNYEKKSAGYSWEDIDGKIHVHSTREEASQAQHWDFANNVAKRMGNPLGTVLEWMGRDAGASKEKQNELLQFGSNVLGKTGTYIADKAGASEHVQGGIEVVGMAVESAIPRWGMARTAATGVGDAVRGANPLGNKTGATMDSAANNAIGYMGGRQTIGVIPRQSSSPTPSKPVPDSGNKVAGEESLPPANQGPGQPGGGRAKPDEANNTATKSPPPDHQKVSGGKPDTVGQTIFRQSSAPPPAARKDRAKLSKTGAKGRARTGGPRFDSDRGGESLARAAASWKGFNPLKYPALKKVDPEVVSQGLSLEALRRVDRGYWLGETLRSALKDIKRLTKSDFNRKRLVDSIAAKGSNSQQVEFKSYEKQPATLYRADRQMSINGMENDIRALASSEAALVRMQIKGKQGETLDQGHVLAILRVDDKQYQVFDPNNGVFSYRNQDSLFKGLESYLDTAYADKGVMRPDSFTGYKLNSGAGKATEAGSKAPAPQPDSQQPFGHQYNFPYIDADHVQDRKTSTQPTRTDSTADSRAGKGNTQSSRPFGEHLDLPYIDPAPVPNPRAITPSAASLADRDHRIKQNQVPDPGSAGYSARLNKLADGVKNDTGVVTSDLPKLQKIAYEHNTIISVRPVDQFATGLIRDGYETKGFHVKGKSASWGPQAGLIAADQRFSKLEGADPARIKKFNDEVAKSIDGHEAVKVPLELSQSRLDELHKLGAIGEMSAPDAHGVRTFEAPAPSGKTYAFEAIPETGGTQPTYAIHYDRKPVEVLAPTAPGAKPFTADYDLFVVGPHMSDLGPQDNLKTPGVEHNYFRQQTDRKNNPDGVNPNLKPAYDDRQVFHQNDDPDMGNVTERVSNLIPVINNALMADTAVPRAKVVHHADETTNPMTDQGANFPATFVLPFKMGKFDEISVVRNKEEFKELIQTAKDNQYQIPVNPLWDADVKDVRSSGFTTAQTNAGEHLQKAQAERSGTSQPAPDSPASPGTPGTQQPQPSQSVQQQQTPQQSTPKQPWFQPPQRLPDGRIGYPAGPTQPPKLPGAPGSGQGAGGSGGGTDGPSDPKRPRPNAEAGQSQQAPGQPPTSTTTSTTTSQDRPQASADRLDNFLLAHQDWRNEDIARVVGVTPNEVDGARHRLTMAGGSGAPATTVGTPSTGAGSKKTVGYAGFQMTEAVRDTIVEHARKFRRQADKVMAKWYNVPPEAIAELRRAHGVPKLTHHEANIPAALWQQIADDARLHLQDADLRIARRHKVPESLVATIRQQEGIGKNSDRRLTPARQASTVAFIRAHVNETDVSLAKTLETSQDTIRKLRRQFGLPRLTGPSLPLTEARKLAISDSMAKHRELSDYDVAKRYNISMETVGRLRNEPGYAGTPALPQPSLPADLPAYAPTPARPGQPPVPVGSAAAPIGQQQADTQPLIQWMADHLSESEIRRIIDLPEQDGQAELAKIRLRMGQPEQGTASATTSSPATPGSPDVPAPVGKPTTEAPTPTASPTTPGSPDVPAPVGKPATEAPTPTASPATSGSPDALPPSPREVQLQGAWDDLNWIGDNYADNRKLIDWMASNLSDQQLQWFLELPLDQVETAAGKIRKYIGLPEPAAVPAATPSPTRTSSSEASSPPSSPREERRQRLHQELGSSSEAGLDTEQVVDWLLTHRTEQQLDRLDRLTDAEFDAEMDRIRGEMYQ